MPIGTCSSRTGCSPARAERLVQALAHGLQVDPQRRERVWIDPPRPYCGEES
jgi:hypothetical protein